MPPTILSIGRAVEKKGFARPDRRVRIAGRPRRHFPMRDRRRRPAGRRFARADRKGGFGRARAPARARARKRKSARCWPARRFLRSHARRDSEGGSDNLPTVIMEAMACGVPVVSTRIAGVPEMIRDGEDGLLVEPRSPEQLAGALAKLLADAPLRERLGAAGKNAAREKFSLEKTVRELKHLLVTRARVSPPAIARAFDPALPPISPWSRLRALFP